ncbi:MAG: hypothetical protein HY800_07820 [Ignavibacteriales bacterium]|nr:hypothetical protein [Ignavibacteriales bacterium]
MAKVIFTISYDVQAEKRAEFLTLMQTMKEHFNQINGQDYSFYQQKGKQNNFTEVFLFNSVEEYNQLDDQDDRMGELVQQLESCLVDGKMKYTTLMEVE